MEEEKQLEQEFFYMSVIRMQSPGTKLLEITIS